MKDFFMMLTLPKTTCWNFPEGSYTATCIDERTTPEYKNGKRKEWLLLVFEIEVDGDDNVQYLAKKKYELPIKHGSQLMNDLSGWLGADFLKKNRTFDADSLKGRKAD